LAGLSTSAPPSCRDGRTHRISAIFSVKLEKYINLDFSHRSMSSSSPENLPESSAPKNNPRQLLLLALLAVGILAIIIMTIVLSARLTTPPPPIATLQPGVTLTPTLSPSWTQTATLTLTLRATFTPRPTGTPTPSLTPTATPPPTLFPSLTPAIPVEENDRFQLAAWTSELADRLIRILDAYPNTLSAFARGEDDRGYYNAFQYAILAQREALLRFPAAPEAQDWLWGLAYNQARTGDQQAGSTFTALITQELNAGLVGLDELNRWGNSQFPPVSIEVIPLETTTGLLSNSLVKVSPGENGSAFFWLLENPNDFISFPLTSDFDFVNPTGVSYFLDDLTGDGNPEVVIYRNNVPEPDQFHFPRIFNLAQQPPVELFFAPHVPSEIGLAFETRWEPIEAGTSEGDLKFTTTVFPTCPVTITHTYGWNGREFDFFDTNYRIDPDPTLLSFCAPVIEHASLVWGLEPTIQLMESLLPSWPPKSSPDGSPYPEDALDEWRYRLGIYHALLGDRSEATGYTNAIITNPATPTSQWIAQAQELLAIYKDQRDIYQACLVSTYCDPQLGLMSLVATFSPEDYANTANLLIQGGVTIRSRGFFDFDNDGRSEQFYILRHLPGSRLEFWILALTSESIAALFVDFVEPAPTRITFIEPLDEPPIVNLEPSTYFRLEKLGVDREPVVTLVKYQVVLSADLTRQALDRIEESLLAGDDPTQLKDDLITLRDSPIFTCNYLLCPRFLYLLGSVNELLNDDRSAIDSFLELWRDFFESPYVTMARLKLAGPAVPPGPTITPTRTKTPRPTQTITRTPTITGTPPTSTPSRTLTPTGTLLTPTPTSTGLTLTPTTTVTPTVTQTGVVPTDTPITPYPPATR
jgi:hypothetical protein